VIAPIAPVRPPRLALTRCSPAWTGASIGPLSATRS
jgi:hypothetical protein